MNYHLLYLINYLMFCEKVVLIVKGGLSAVQHQMTKS